MSGQPCRMTGRNKGVLVRPRHVFVYVPILDVCMHMYVFLYYM